jgi:nucleoside-diphosphate-sugar epimerase
MESVVAITGASGFLGRACCDAFTAAGFRVRALVRRPEAHRDLEAAALGGVFRGQLPGGIDPAAFDGDIRAIVHCAYATTATNDRDAQAANVEGTEALRRMARQAAIPRFVFISSLAAHRGAASLYGRTKFQLEQRFTSAQDTVVKPGTIIGPGGIFERTRETIRRLPIVPLLYGDRALQTVWIGDVCAGIVEAVRRSIPGVIVLAHPEPVSMRQFYRSIAQADGRRAVLLPVPGDLALLAIRALERTGMRLPITSDNLLGIKHLEWFDPEPSARRLGLRPIGFRESLAKLTGAAVPL